ncbi:lipopolysaccharide biosynthesis protein [Anaeromyxobacter paludicola]|uniref:Polysaccharide biosynthesis protein n=1 Tax=Anaeromyxobacter paludicola TaxID=2918171 RepID=A0ABM7XC28_9BACT|nr:oligosaccharide flippase family protein [Anaeromyxobacter paludicola]BDG09419.1 hypothetical protein AMPC_25320 [Anaeromyxobacter paludicola]
MLARLAGAALTFGAPLVLARVLLPAQYGTFKQAWLVINTLYLVLPLGVTPSLYYFVPREPAERDRYIAQALLATTAVGALAALLVLLARPLLELQFHNPELDRHLPWVAGITFLYLAGTSLDHAYNSLSRIGAAAAVRVATEGARAAAMIGGALATRSLEGLFAGIALALGLRAAAAWALLARAHGLRGSRAALKAQLGYALPFGVAFLALIPQQQFHQYAVAASVSAAAFAVYSVGCFQLPIVDVLYTPVSEVLQLGLAEDDRQGGRGGLALFHEAVARLSFAFLPLMGVLFTCAPALIGFLFTDRYLAAAPIFRISLASVALSALPLDGVMRARAQNRFVLAAALVKLAATVPLVLAGLRLLGPPGAMAGWIAGEALGRLLLLQRTATLFGVPLLRALPLRELSRYGLATALATPPAWLALHAAPTRFTALAVCGLCFLAAYLGVLWWMGWLPVGLPLRRGSLEPSPTGQSVEPAADGRVPGRAGL